MGAFSGELITARTEPPDPLRGLTFVDANDYSGQHANAEMLIRLLGDAASIPGGAYLYFPPGRYLIGRPSSFPVEGGTEQHADIIVPWNVTLKFASGAQLVPMGYADAHGELVSGAEVWGGRRTLSGLQDAESFKVRIEIQGRVEAGIFPIFDAFVHQSLDDMRFQEAGRVLFQRDQVRAVYPEWWNALPMVNEEVPNAARVRRTTVALQMALDAAHNRRVSSWREPTAAPHPSIPLVLVNDYAIDRPLRVGATFNQASGQEPIHDDAAREAPANRNGLVIRGECGPATRRFGAALIKAAPGFVVPTGPSMPAGPDVAHPEQTEVSSLLVLRTSVGVTVQNVVFDANESAQRCVTVASPFVDNQTLEADGMTRHQPGFTPSHHNGFEGCEFRNALRALVYVGGELPLLPDSLNDNKMPGTGVVKSLTVDTLARTGIQDLSGMRFTRCFFVTGTTEKVREAVARTPSSPDKPLPISEFRADYAEGLARYWRVGVLHRARESLVTEFHGCSFSGPASPMLLLLGGRFSVQNCTFRTDTIKSGNGPSATLADRDLRQWDGTDILLPVALRERYLGPALQPVGVASMTARHVESRSRQFLATFSGDARAGLGHPTYCSVTLIHVRHRNDFRAIDAAITPSTTIERPAIYWGGPRRFNVALTLHGCVFSERDSVSGVRGGVYVAADGVGVAPVVDLGSRRMGGGEVLVNPNIAAIQGVLRLGALADGRTGR